MAPPDGSTAAQREPWLDQSATVLAQQLPPTDQDSLKTKQPMADWDTVRQHVESRLIGMRLKRWAWWRRSAVVARFMAPDRYHFFVYANRTYRDGIVGEAIVNNTASTALRTCGAGMWNGITNPSKPWFELGIALPWVTLEDDGAAWLKDTTERLNTVLAQSNFYSTTAQAFRDISAFGTSPIIIYENADKVIICYLPCPGEYYLEVGSTFEVETLYREYTMTVLQIVQEFKIDNCPEQIKLAYSRGRAELDKEFVVTHCIEPNFPLIDRSNGKRLDVVPASFPYRELYMIQQLGPDGELSRTGCREKPFVAGRWSKVSNDSYAPMCPGLEALGDVQGLQQLEKREAEFIEKGARPPMGADIQLQNQPASTLPGHTTFMNTANGKGAYWPLFELSPQWIAPIEEKIKQMEERINRTFFVDAFMAITQMEGVQPRNELELTTRNLERLQPLGPPINLLTEEFASPMIQRILAIMQRRGMLQQPPQSLRGVPLKINYVGIMQEAQKQAASVGMKDFAATVGEMAEGAITAGVVPSPARIIDWDAFTRELAKLDGITPNLLKTDEVVKQEDAARTQQRQQMQAMQTGMAGVQAAQTLSQTPTGPGTALHALTGGAFGGGQPQQPQQPQGVAA